MVGKAFMHFDARSFYGDLEAQKKNFDAGWPLDYGVWSGAVVVVRRLYRGKGVSPLLLRTLVSSACSPVPAYKGGDKWRRWNNSFGKEADHMGSMQFQKHNDRVAKV